MSKKQPTLFEGARMSIADSIDLTIQSLIGYGSNRHWVITWSGGKDSTTLVTLVIQLIRAGLIPAPKSITILYADTRQELPPLEASVWVIQQQLAEIGIQVRTVVAALERRFLPYILGRGVPPPNNNTLRWCQRQIKIEPMTQAVVELAAELGEKPLVLTGVRMGESAARDARIKLSCGTNDGECGQGWYQKAIGDEVADKLAPILHWRSCLVWDWLGVYAPTKRPDLFDEWPGLSGGGWNTRLLAEAYGDSGDGSAEELDARTGCVGCPLANHDVALDNIIKLPDWAYIAPLQGLRPLYRQMRLPQYRLRQPGGEKRKDGSLVANQNRMGPLTINARRHFMNEILAIQTKVAAGRPEHHPKFEVLNAEEIAFICKCWEDNVYPNRWTGEEPTADQPFLESYADGSKQLDFFIG